MKKALLLICLISIVAALMGCDNDDDESLSEELSQEQEQMVLAEMLGEIEALADSVECTDPQDWTFTSIGSKACGGPTHFIAYPVQIDVDAFLVLVGEYTSAQRDFNEKWEVASTCDVPSEPSSIECINRKPVFVY